jgi:hypothetical protein
MFYGEYHSKKGMITKFFFKRLSAESQANFMKKRGISLGSRWKDGRYIYMYMFRNLFAEILFVGDKTDNDPEQVTVISGINEFNKRLEDEIRPTKGHFKLN